MRASQCAMVFLQGYGMAMEQAGGCMRIARCWALIMRVRKCASRHMSVTHVGHVHVVTLCMSKPGRWS
jgi:hypothetical protein